MDTNVWLERLLDQERSEEVRRYLDATPSDQLAITDFAYHSIGLALTRLRAAESFLVFVQDIVVDGAVSVLRLPAEGARRQFEVMRTLGLDYDDAYQYVVAEYFGARLVSFDTDFDGTPLGRTTPTEAIASRAADEEGES